jgi:hypothetical protein
MLGIPEPRRQSSESNVLSGHLAGIGDGTDTETSASMTRQIGERSS